MRGKIPRCIFKEKIDYFHLLSSFLIHIYTHTYTYIFDVFFFFFEKKEEKKPIKLCVWPPVIYQHLVSLKFKASSKAMKEQRKNNRFLKMKVMKWRNITRFMRMRCCEFLVVRFLSVYSTVVVGMQITEMIVESFHSAVENAEPSTTNSIYMDADGDVRRFHALESNLLSSNVKSRQLLHDYNPRLQLMLNRLTTSWWLLL